MNSSIEKSHLFQGDFRRVVIQRRIEPVVLVELIRPVKGELFFEIRMIRVRAKLNEKKSLGNVRFLYEPISAIVRSARTATFSLRDKILRTRPARIRRIAFRNRSDTIASASAKQRNDERTETELNATDIFQRQG